MPHVELRRGGVSADCCTAGAVEEELYQAQVTSTKWAGGLAGLLSPGK